MINSHALVFKDFDSLWYRKWAKELLQDSDHLDGHALRANKFWQNAVICQALKEKHKIKAGLSGIGFGVGEERLPAVFANHRVSVLATDQDYTSKDSKLWSAKELATGLPSLNKLAIADADEFKKQVKYLQLDMNNIPADLNSKFDFVWSNCSLGHLGSISNGLGFIYRSLGCLNKNGVAVHTTEVNLVSDNDTLTTGSTVIFRLKDIHRLLTQLTREGYICSPLRFKLGNSKADQRVCMQPRFGNDYSKIQVGGYISTQVVLIIRKPKYRLIEICSRRIRLQSLKISYRINSYRQAKFKKTNQYWQQVISAAGTLPEDIHLRATTNEQVVRLKTNKTLAVYLEYVNKSPCCLYSHFGHPKVVKPVILATSQPRDRSSSLANESWISKNRASSAFYLKEKNGSYKSLDYVKPGQRFSFKVNLDLKSKKTDASIEHFEAVIEDSNWIEGSGMALKVKAS